MRLGAATLYADYDLKMITRAHGPADARPRSDEDYFRSKYPPTAAVIISPSLRLAAIDDASVLKTLYCATLPGTAPLDIARRC